MTASPDLASQPRQVSDAPSKRAVIYLRVSTAEQASKDGDTEGYSLPAQRQANHRRAASLDAWVVEEFADRGETGKNSKRPGLKAMLAYVAEQPVDYVIVHKVDRLARNRADDVEITLALRAAGVQLVSATENIDETPGGMLMHGIMSSIAEFYSANLATEVLKGMTQKAKSGGTPGKAPLGYRNVIQTGSDGKPVRTVVVDETRAPHIQWAYQAYASGEWTVKKITEELVSRGLTTLPTSRYPSKPISVSTMHTILTNPYYKGVVTWKGVLYPDGRHPKLVTPELWQAVQDHMATRRSGVKERKHPHYLKESLRCAKCGSKMTITNAKNRQGVIYPYFICIGRHQKRNDCKQKAVLIDEVSALVEEAYERTELTDEQRAGIQALAEATLADSRQQADIERQQLTEQRTRLLDQRSKLLQAHFADALPLDLLKTEQERVARELTVIDAKLDKANASVADVAHTLTRAMDFLSRCARAYDRATDPERRLLNLGLFEAIWVGDDEIDTTLASPFKELMSIGQTGSANEQSSDNNKPAPFDSAGLKDHAVVPPTGFEPALPP